METDRIALSQRESDRLCVLHEIRQKQTTQIEAAQLCPKHRELRPCIFEPFLSLLLKLRERIPRSGNAVTSTPVIDRARDAIYVIAVSKNGSGNYFHRLRALDLTSGKELFNGPTTIAATFPGGPTSRLPGCTKASDQRTMTSLGLEGRVNLAPRC